MTGAPPPQSVNLKAGTLAAVVGATAAAMLIAHTATEESSRKVQATIAPDGTSEIRHVSGRQYLKVYIDIAGVPTACDGLTRDEFGRPMKPGRTFTEAQCAVMLDRALAAHAIPVMQCVPGLKDRPYQITAAVSLAYNIGPTAFCRSTAARRFNAGQWRAGCSAFGAWNKARVKGVLRPVLGLTRRRAREEAICEVGL